MIKENIYYSKPYLDNSDLNCLKTVFKSNFLTQGPKINEFEKKFLVLLMPNIQLVLIVQLVHYTQPAIV